MTIESQSHRCRDTAELSDPGACKMKPFAVAVKSRRRASVLAVTGDLDLSTAPRLVVIMTRELRKHPSLLVLDLTEVDFLGVPAVAAIMTGWQQRGEHTQLRLVARKRAALRLIHLTGLDDFLAIYDSLETAIQEYPAVAGV
ncbi:STAS domain-containing protein [Amycolatopsis sp. YIM 10]|uniref:STAS domain-containing protein n=1 Tax=Amycolatopsis sp. YIM 10 TaxID=2653857 RepID=UPI001290450D|nr:STAS domain-containing protein [Amycolatopsis sp. YIM 10]QFU86811.1 Anti-sigma-F factor antagonist RsfB [Amycolatopsis sp. YIM 10]